jgi:hypothetical protein
MAFKGFFKGIKNEIKNEIGRQIDKNINQKGSTEDDGDVQQVIHYVKLA